MNRRNSCERRVLNEGPPKGQLERRKKEEVDRRSSSYNRRNSEKDRRDIIPSIQKVSQESRSTKESSGRRLSDKEKNILYRKLDSFKQSLFKNFDKNKISSVLIIANPDTSKFARSVEMLLNSDRFELKFKSVRLKRVETSFYDYVSSDHFLEYQMDSDVTLLFSPFPGGDDISLCSDFFARFKIPSLFFCSKKVFSPYKNTFFAKAKMVLRGY